MKNRYIRKQQKKQSPIFTCICSAHPVAWDIYKENRSEDDEEFEMRKLTAKTGRKFNMEMPMYSFESIYTCYIAHRTMDVGLESDDAVMLRYCEHKLPLNRNNWHRYFVRFSFCFFVFVFSSIRLNLLLVSRITYFSATELSLQSFSIEQIEFNKHSSIQSMCEIANSNTNKLECYCTCVFVKWFKYSLNSLGIYTSLSINERKVVVWMECELKPM